MKLLCNKSREFRQNYWKELAMRTGFNMQKMSVSCRLSRRQMERYFQIDFQTTPQKWLEKQKMEAAKVLLRDAETVKEVAYELGFKQVSHFCRVFKKNYGMTPTEFDEETDKDNNCRNRTIQCV